jgi:hypothetical protein
VFVVQQWARALPRRLGGRKGGGTGCRQVAIICCTNSNHIPTYMLDMWSLLQLHYKQASVIMSWLANNTSLQVAIRR